MGVAAVFYCLAGLFALPVSAEVPDDIVFVAPSAGGHALLRYRGDTDTIDSLGVCAADARPAWSADGLRLAFEEPAASGGTAVCWYDFSGGGTPVRHTVVSVHGSQRRPAWSAQGRLLAYEAGGGQPYEGVIAVYDTQDGSETAWAGGRAGFFSPVWLPTPRILFAIDPEDSAHLPGLDMDVLLGESGLTSGEALTGITRALFAIGLAGEPGSLSTELFLITQSLALPVLQVVPDIPDSLRFEEWQPVPSPSGSRMVYESNDGGDREIYHLDQRGQSNLSNHRAADWNPVWAPNSRLLAFESFANGRRGVYRLIADTALRTPVAVSDERDYWAPSWAPDSDRVVCVTNRGDGPELAVFDADDAEDITPSALVGTRGWAPAWRPEE
jgi:Tol biopolymer transport system component